MKQWSLPWKQAARFYFPLVLSAAFWLAPGMAGAASATGAGPTWPVNPNKGLENEITSAEPGGAGGRQAQQEHLGSGGSFGIFSANPNPNLSKEAEYALPGGRSGCGQRPTIADELADLVSGVYPFSGESYRVEEDVLVRGRVIDFHFVRKYRSQGGPDTAMGNRWDHSYNIWIAPEGTGWLVSGGFARIDLYRPSGPNQWTHPHFFRLLQQNSDGTLSLHFCDGGTWNFHAYDGAPTQGKIADVTDRNGNRMSFGYDGQGRLSTIRDDLNRAYTLSYDGNGRIQSLCDFAGRCWTYSYYGVGSPEGMPGDLESVTTPPIVGTPNGNDFPNGRTVRYTYTTGHPDDRLNHLLSTVRNARGEVFLWNEYDRTSAPTELSFGRLIRQRWGDFDDIVDLVYVALQPNPANHHASLRVILNTRDGAVKEAFYNAAKLGVMYREFTGFADPDQPTTASGNRPGPALRSSDPLFFEYRWNYEASGLVKGVQFPSGASIRRRHDIHNPDPRARGNLLEMRRLAGPIGADQLELVETFEYLPGHGNCCANSFVTRHVDARGNEVHYEYDSAGNRTKVIGPEPNAVNEWQYDSFGRVTAIIDAEDGEGRRRRDEFLYYTSGPMRGRLQRLTIDALGLALSTTYEYDALGNRIRAIDAQGNDTQGVFNVLGEVVREISMPLNEQGVRGKKDRFMDADGNLVQIDRENRNHAGALQANTSFSTLYEYDQLGRVVKSHSEVDEASTVTEEYRYNPNGLPSFIRSGEAVNGNQPLNVVQRMYDERGKLYREVVNDGKHEIIFQRDYNADGYLVRTVDGVGPKQRAYHFTVDGYGRRTAEIDPMGNRRATAFDANSNIVLAQVYGELLDVNGADDNVLLHEMRQGYDRANRPIRAEATQFDPSTGDPVGEGAKVTDWIYAQNGALRSRATVAGGSYLVERDSAGRKIRELFPSGVERRSTWNELNRLVRLEVTHPSDSGGSPQVLVTTMDYSPDGKLIRKVNPDGGVWQFGWDSRENRTLVVDPRGNTTLEVVDGAHRIVEEKVLLTESGDGSGTVIDEIRITRIYDDNHRAVQRIDDSGRATTYTWDALNRLVQTTHADGTTIAYQYNAVGDLERLTDANGSVIDLGYDLNWRLVRRDIAPGAGVSASTTFETFTYDGLGQVARGTNNLTSVTRQHDSLGNLLAETIDGVTVRGQTDAEGNPLHLDYPSGLALDFTYDSDGRAETIARNGAILAEFDYLGGIGLEMARYPVGTGQGAVEERLAYDAAGRSQRLSVARDHGNGQMTLLDDRSFLWDPAGNRTRVRDLVPAENPTREFQYDSANRIIRSTTETIGGQAVVAYSLNGVGDRTLVQGGNDPGSYASDVMHQYTTTPFDQRTYDAAGNLRTRSGSTGDQELTWNYKNELVRVENLASGKIITYRYDVFGRPVRRNETGAGAHTLRYRWFGDGLVEEENSTTGAIRSYAHAAGDIRMVLSASDVWALHPDRTGSVFSVTRGDGSLGARYDYDDFGNASDLSAPLVSNNRLFGGLWLDEDLAIYRAGHRFYDPRTGKFISRDPLGVWGDPAGSGNASLYAAANPWSRRDPSGLKVECSDFGTPDEIMCYEFDACTASDEDDVHDWIIGRTLAGVEAAEWYVHTGDENSYLLEVWFDGHTGDVDANEYDTIHTEMYTVEDYMEDSTLTFECEYNGGWSNWCNDEDDGGRGYAAYVYIPDKVHLCDRYFDNKSDWDVADSYASDSDQSTYYHELNHAKHWWTDQGYYLSDSVGGSDTNPNYDTGIGADQTKLRKNPDTYSSMAELGEDLEQNSGYFSDF